MQKETRAQDVVFLVLVMLGLPASWFFVCYVLWTVGQHA